MILTTFSASIVSLTLPAEPLDPRTIFVVAAFMVYGFEERFQNPADFKPFPQLALSVFQRLDSAQKFAVTAVVKQEAAVAAGRDWEADSWEQYVYQRGSNAWQCGWDIARLLMHWYSEDRLPSARTNQALQLERRCASFTDKILVGQISSRAEYSELVKSTQRAYVETTKKGAMERIRLWRDQVAQYQDNMNIGDAREASEPSSGISGGIQISESKAMPRDIGANGLRLLLDLLGPGGRPILRFVPPIAAMPSAPVYSQSPSGRLHIIIPL